MLNTEQTQFLDGLFRSHPALLPLRQALLDAYEALRKAYDQQGKVLVCGNGGSAADSEHIVGELLKGFLKKRPLTPEQHTAFDGLPDLPQGFADHLQQPLPAISLVSQCGLLTAFGNDVAPDMAYAQQAYAYGQPNDVLIALSTSGNSGNVVNAVYAAKAKGMRTIAITGAKESKLSKLCDVCLRTPETETYRVQEYTLPLYHALCALVELCYFAE